MAEPPDLDDLARRYVELWQDQWTALATDPRTTESMTRAMALFAEWAAPMARSMGVQAPVPPGPGNDGGASGTAAVGAASGGGDQRLDELDRRLAAVEQRLARLESAASAQRPRAGTRRRKS